MNPLTRATFSALLLLLPAPGVAQMAGAAVSGLDPVIVDGEVRGQVTVQSGATVLESAYRFAIVPDVLDMGLRLGALSPEGEATTVATAIDLRVALMTADHPAALLPLDVAATLGAGAAFPGWTDQIVTIPVGLSLGGALPFDTGVTRPEQIRVWVHPRVEYARRVQGDCIAATTLCQRGWVFRSDLGVSGDLSERSRWFAALGFGDTRYAGTGFSLGLRARW